MHRGTGRSERTSRGRRRSVARRSPLLDHLVRIECRAKTSHQVQGRRWRSPRAGFASEFGRSGHEQERPARGDGRRPHRPHVLGAARDRPVRDPRSGRGPPLLVRFEPVENGAQLVSRRGDSGPARRRGRRVLLPHGCISRGPAQVGDHPPGCVGAAEKSGEHATAREELDCSRRHRHVEDFRP